MATAGGARPLLLWNRTASEPEGLYLRHAEPVSVGALVAFPAPSAAFPYANGHMAYLRRVPILKSVAAVAGDHVCAANDRLEINGRVRAPILRQDRRGAALPRWDGCRRLRDGEVFVFSDRIPNSFDSRYFGPVNRAEIVGVFRPLAVPLVTPGDR
ncbi:S26 family signal peptidase [Phenylobacterium sp. J367]|uniref:S26 family signal peptidase n=1 Tax=Phenylobacterium sp. J367 TaxID=2898435 RepID=UPI002151A0B6|nr:S26 family signal peptidase [Phenylobacterium sp. J367]MCR5881230.1 S26 family signal peptidase [Phenylobacterium sp. J367]